MVYPWSARSISASPHFQSPARLFDLTKVVISTRFLSSIHAYRKPSEEARYIVKVAVKPVVVEASITLNEPTWTRRISSPTRSFGRGVDEYLQSTIAAYKHLFNGTMDSHGSKSTVTWTKNYHANDSQGQSWHRLGAGAKTKYSCFQNWFAYYSSAKLII